MEGVSPADVDGVDRQIRIGIGLCGIQYGDVWQLKAEFLQSAGVHFPFCIASGVDFSFGTKRTRQEAIGMLRLSKMLFLEWLFRKSQDVKIKRMKTSPVIIVKAGIYGTAIDFF